MLPASVPVVAPLRSPTPLRFDQCISTQQSSSLNSKSDSEFEGPLSIGTVVAPTPLPTNTVTAAGPIHSVGIESSNPPSRPVEKTRKVGSSSQAVVAPSPVASVSEDPILVVESEQLPGPSLEVNGPRRSGRAKAGGATAKGGKARGRRRQT